ncbi:NAD(P)H-dependent oxidoreductase [Chitinophaga sp. GCM10012297]|uniref:NAD(P)H-dependent oxidoreductase n=1 Tax=Chitinophaga chungangae TaxID=2821488 RepID=A0ABS3YJG8_9BACT|nr:NAD(P)H-dependent oxidoreductase [Chitinophaga chungangae]MBO9154826.1 NAD(P)H-dependent oxidoreductase [Chitinophaga chungangae]
MKVLILFAHPAFERSRVHSRLINAAKQQPGVTLRDLYEVYPDFDVHPDTEQQILQKHDVIIFQHPLYWYSGPALLKQWMDLVLEHGWAYGKEGVALKGKYMLQVISTGGNEHAYSPEGHHGHPVKQFMLPFEQSAKLCNMEYLSPFVVHGTNQLTELQLDEYAERYATLLQTLQADRLDLQKARQISELNNLIALPPIISK